MSRTPTTNVYQGVPCKRGHAGIRRRGNGDCVECARLRAALQYTNNTEARKAYGKARYRANPARIRGQVADRKRREPEKVRAEKRAEYERHSEIYKRRAGAARVLRHQRMPAWLTPAHQQQILSAYQAAAAATERTGVKHEVDHIVPIAGRCISGLHVPWNLQVLTQAENRRKRNKFTVTVSPP